jgi:hypothetical protein
MQDAQAWAAAGNALQIVCCQHMRPWLELQALWAQQQSCQVLELPARRNMCDTAPLGTELYSSPSRCNRLNGLEAVKAENADGAALQ